MALSKRRRQPCHWSSPSCRSSLAAFSVLLQLKLQSATEAPCADDSSWKDATYGSGCDFYAKSDPGCKKFVDLGQITSCNLTCGNCDGLRVQNDTSPLHTSCSMTELCACFEGCSPAALCPASDAAQSCRLVSVAAKTILPLSATQPWLELVLPSTEEVVGVDVQGAKTRYAKTVTATCAESTATSANFVDIDSGLSLAANWEGGHPARALFAQGAVKARVLRVYPNITSGGLGSTSLSATAIVRRCTSPPDAEPTSASGKCADLKCRAYCYKALSCEGSWLDYCEIRKEQLEKCDVECSHATSWHVGAFAVMALIMRIAP